MRRFVLAVFVVVGLTIVASASLSITRFLVELEVLSSGELSVVETLDVMFDTPHHGIYREIPESYRRPSGERLSIDSDVAGVSLDEAAVPYTVRRSGDDVVIRVGDPDQVITGAHAYKIAYTVNRALLFGNPDYIQLYWNATGNDWQVPIDRVIARVQLPESVSAHDVPTTSYIGFVGSSARGQPAIRSAEGVFVFEATGLAPGEGLTIDVAIPREASGIAAPTTGEKAVHFIRSNWYALLPVLTLLLMLLWWWRKGKDPRIGVIAPRFDPPKNIRPGEAGVLIDDRVDLQDISAMVIDLAVNGFLTIREIDEEDEDGPIEGSAERSGSQPPTEYQFTKLKDADGSLTEVEQLVLDGIFDETHPDTRTLSSMEHSFYKVLPSIKRALYARLIKKHYYASDPEDVWAGYVVLAGAIAAAGVTLGVILSSLVLGISVAACGLIVFAFAWIMPRKTRKGAEALREVLGLAAYIERAEVRRLEFHDAPERSPRDFQKILPYAVALNLTKIWTKQFVGLLERPPEWYSGSRHRFTERQLGLALARLSSGLQRSFVSAPRTRRTSRGRSAWGSSARFGGGSSGGGFGGGGGGGW